MSMPEEEKEEIKLLSRKTMREEGDFDKSDLESITTLNNQIDALPNNESQTLEVIPVSFDSQYQGIPIHPLNNDFTIPTEKEDIIIEPSKDIIPTENLSQNNNSIEMLNKVEINNHIHPIEISANPVANMIENSNLPQITTILESTQQIDQSVRKTSILETEVQKAEQKLEEVKKEIPNKDEIKELVKKEESKKEELKEVVKKEDSKKEEIREEQMKEELKKEELRKEEPKKEEPKNMKITLTQAKKEIEEFKVSLDQIEGDILKKYGIKISDFSYDSNLPEDFSIRIFEEYFKDKKL
jgi:hypothetical protein